MAKLTSIKIIWVAALAIAAASILLRTHKGNYTPRDIRLRYGDWAIVAGASEGLGAAWAEHLCEYGLNVLLVARRKEALEASAKKIQQRFGCQTDTWVQDLSDPNLADIFRSVLKKRDEWNRTRQYGMLIYNAAHVSPGPFLDVPLEKQQTSIAVNVKGVATLVHVFANYVRNHPIEKISSNKDGESVSSKVDGGIILMTSITALTGTREYANYAATKAWILQLAHGLYDELKQSRLDILACVAGATWTPNYQSGGGSLQDFGLQQPKEVVQECLQAMGTTPSLATGPFNKLVRFLFTRILPHNLVIRIMNQAVEQRMLS